MFSTLLLLFVLALKPSSTVPSRRFLSRRHAVALLAAGVVSAVSAGVLFRGRLRQWARDFVGRRAVPSLTDSEPGPLTSGTWEALLALPNALVDREVDRERYREFFRFRTESLRGYRTLYESFASDVESRAARLTGRSFADSTAEDRRTVLQDLGLTPGLMSPWRALVSPRELLRYDHFIVREVLQFFSATDAWVHAGYGAWPGQLRTLEYYLSPVPGSEA
jgi:hypothetical protein